MKKRLITGCLTLLLWQPWSTADQTLATEDAKRHHQKQKSEWQQYLLDNAAAFQSYKDEFRAGLAAYKNRVRDVWGYAEVSTESKWVYYSEDYTQKLVVDYKNNAIALQRIDAKQSVTTEGQKQSVAFIAQALAQQTGTGNIAQSIGVKPDGIEKLAMELVSENNVQHEDFVKASIADLKGTKAKLQAQATQLSIPEQRKERKFISEIDKEIEANEKLLKNDTKPNKKMISAKFKLNNSRLEKAMLYEGYVVKQAKYYGLPESLIYAVMEVESSFNPRAQSPIPAFGLMQVVPTTAGKDVNKYLNKGNLAPTSTQLFNPPENVLFGSTYLSMLYQRYFKKIKDPVSRSYCVIAAYNTGMGNVAAIFSRDGSKNLTKAARVINEMTPQQVHDKIKSRAHSETRRYITKVLTAQSYFETRLN